MQIPLRRSLVAVFCVFCQRQSSILLKIDQQAKGGGLTWYLPVLTNQTYDWFNFRTQEDMSKTRLPFSEKKMDFVCKYNEKSISNYLTGWIMEYMQIAETSKGFCCWWWWFEICLVHSALSWTSLLLPVYNSLDSRKSLPTTSVKCTSNHDE